MQIYWQLEAHGLIKSNRKAKVQKKIATKLKPVGALQFAKSRTADFILFIGLLMVKSL